MNTIFEIFKMISPSIITGLCTFLITKYTYNKNRPLDKMETAYNRIYYPIYKIISDKNINKNIDMVIDKSKIYFIKYDKYVDLSTKRLFKSLCECDKEAKRKSVYQSFKDNIYNRNSYLRVRLGYLEPNFFQIYKYAAPSSKSAFRITLEFCIIYLSAILITIATKLKNEMFLKIVLFVFLCLLFIMVIEVIWCFLRFLYYKIRK